VVRCHPAPISLRLTERRAKTHPERLHTLADRR
jgi:hypothetical protein